MAVSWRWSAIVLLAAAGGLAALSLYQAVGELRPYVVSDISAERRFGAIAASEYSPGTSFASKDLFLSDCLEVADSLFAKAQPTERRSLFLEACRSEAQRMTAAMPTYGLAWFVSASMDAALQDKSGFQNDLVLASRTSPNSHWLAERRIRLAERFPDWLEGSAEAAYRRDLRALLDSPQGARVLAERYAAEPKLRGLYTDIVLTSPAELQSRFLSEVKSTLATVSAQ